MAQHHIYYFQLHTGNIVENDAILAQLFIGILKMVAFEWFRNLPKGSITCWDDLGLFLSRFFKEELDVNMHTLLLTKQREGQIVKDFVERFQDLTMRSRSGMTQETLIKICHHKILAPILGQMGGEWNVGQGSNYKTQADS